MILKKNDLFCLILLFIVALIPFLDFLIFNLGLINERTDLRVNELTIQRLAFLFFIILFILYFLFFVFKNLTSFSNFKISIFLSLTYWILFQYNNIKKIFSFEILKSFKIYDGEISFALIIIIILCYSFYAVRKKTIFINNFILIFLLLNFFFNLFSLINFKNYKSKNYLKNVEYQDLKLNKKDVQNNIYYLVLDALPTLKNVNKFLNFQTEDFLSNLNILNFKYIEDSKSHYGNTFLSLGSVFNLKKFDLIEDKHGDNLNNLKTPNLIFPTVLREKNLSNLEYNLKKSNYNFKWIGSYFSNCYGYNPSYCLNEIEKKNIFFNYEILSFLKKTPFQPVVFKILKIFNSDVEKKIIFESNNSISKLIKYLETEGKPETPSFIFIHHLISHWPYLVDKDCNYKKFEGKTNIEGIENAFKCNAKLILNFAKLVSEIDEDAIVIIQSDHNWELSYKNPLKFGDRREIFNLIKFNKNCEDYTFEYTDPITVIKQALLCATNTKSF